jgi:hypothetical protein
VAFVVQHSLIGARQFISSLFFDFAAVGCEDFAVSIWHCSMNPERKTAFTTVILIIPGLIAFLERITTRILQPVKV